MVTQGQFVQQIPINYTVVNPTSYQQPMGTTVSQFPYVTVPPAQQPLLQQQFHQLQIQQQQQQQQQQPQPIQQTMVKTENGMASVPSMEGTTAQTVNNNGEFVMVPLLSPLEHPHKQPQQSLPLQQSLIQPQIIQQSYLAANPSSSASLGYQKQSYATPTEPQAEDANIAFPESGRYTCLIRAFINYINYCKEHKILPSIPEHIRHFDFVLQKMTGGYFLRFMSCLNFTFHEKFDEKLADACARFGIHNAAQNFQRHSMQIELSFKGPNLFCPSKGLRKHICKVRYRVKLILEFMVLHKLMDLLQFNQILMDYFANNMELLKFKKFNCLDHGLFLCNMDIDVNTKKLA
ncbi:unnamed protein product [Ambrosiozyma monospora]|uniref:Unnamed protein product n=1 Tax=Ambrosiozyma monospora TaxID=43982 RepID=A0A9W6YXG0_AMBMO|nr:unnamed protein product [Ambrosiozyma monospora]